MTWLNFIGMWINWVFPYFNPDVLLIATMLNRSSHFGVLCRIWRFNSLTSLGKVHSMMNEGFWFFIAIIDILLPTELIEYRFIVVEKVLVTSGEPFDNLSQYSSSIGFNKAWNHFIGDILCWCPEHLLKLGCWKTLNYDILLFFFELIFLLKIKLASLSQCWMSLCLNLRATSCSRTCCSGTWLYCHGNMLRVLFLVQTLQQSLPSFLHSISLDSRRYQSLLFSALLISDECHT